MTKWGGKSCPFGSSHGKQEIILYHEESTQIITLFLLRKEGRCSVRGWDDGMGKGLVGSIYMKAVIVIHVAQKARVKHRSEDLCLEHKPKTWGIFPFQLNILSITAYRLKPHSLNIMQEGSFSLLKVFHVKDLHTCTFLRENALNVTAFLFLCRWFVSHTTNPLPYTYL